jgi:hypothetical protein
MSKFGYYSVGDFTSYSKVEAAEQAKSTNSNVTWHFLDAECALYPWKIDSQVDLKKLYRQRAEQIRNQYDYIVIWYSGGADSTNVLKSFVDNNIHIDEIAQFHAEQGEHGWNSYLNLEVAHVAVPQTKKLLERLPNTKHRMVDFTPFIVDLFDKENKFDFIYQSNWSMSPHQLARTYFRERIKDYADIIASGKKLCFVWGADKPPLRYDVELDRYYIQFHDAIDSGGVGPRSQRRKDQGVGEYDEYFYWSPEGLDIVARQAHIGKNYLRNIPDPDLISPWLTTNPVQKKIAYDGTYRDINVPIMPYGTVNGSKYYLTYDGLHRLIYDEWDHQTLNLGKTIGYIFGPRDAWWHRIQGQEQKLFSTGVISYYKKFGNALFVNHDRNSQQLRHINFKTFYTPKYYIE